MDYPLSLIDLKGAFSACLCLRVLPSERLDNSFSAEFQPLSIQKVYEVRLLGNGKKLHSWLLWSVLK